MLDLSKPVQCRNGYKARILCTDRKVIKCGVSYPIVGLHTANDGSEYICSWQANGKLVGGNPEPHPLDLVNVPEKLVPHVHAEVIRAFADGHTIQWFCRDTQTWADVACPSFLSHEKYRVKP